MIEAAGVQRLGVQHHFAAFAEPAHAGQAGQVIDVERLTLGLHVHNENVEHFPLFRIVVQAAEVFNVFDFPRAGGDAVVQMVQIVVAGADLAPDAVLRNVQIVGMHDALEGAAGESDELFRRIALKNLQQFLVGIQQFFVAVGLVNKKAAGDVGKPAGNILFAEISVQKFAGV